MSLRCTRVTVVKNKSCFGLKLEIVYMNVALPRWPLMETIVTNEWDRLWGELDMLCVEFV